MMFVLAYLPYSYFCCILFRRSFFVCTGISLFSKIGLALHQMIIRLMHNEVKKFRYQLLFSLFIPSHAFAIGLYYSIEQSYKVFMWDRQDEEMIKAVCASNPTLPCCPSTNKRCKKFHNFFENDNIQLAVFTLFFNFIFYSLLLYFYDIGKYVFMILVGSLKSKFINFS